MAYQPGRNCPDNLLAVVPSPEDGTDEFNASLLMHLALLLLATAVMALRGPAIPALPKVIPIRFLGALAQSQPGSAHVLMPVPASKIRAGERKKMSSGETPKGMAKTSSVKKTPAARKTPSPQKVKNPGVQKKAGKPSPTATDREAPMVVQEPSLSSTARPFIAPMSLVETSSLVAEPTASALPEVPLVQDELGEPQFMEAPAELESAPPAPGEGDTTAPSGVPADTISIGGGEMEIDGIESMAGGSDAFAPPKVVSRVLPEYPAWARKTGVKGQAVYKVLIQESGTVGDVINLVSTIDPKLAIVGAQSLRRWVFTPVMVNGEPRETWVRITVQFHLK